MSEDLARGEVGAPFVQPAGQIAGHARLSSRSLSLVLVIVGAFGLYWGSSFILEARRATTHFGADTWFYAELAKSDVIGRMSSNYLLDRITRFHPVTVAMAMAWVELLKPLTLWITPQHLLMAMFAAIGAVGVWAALAACSAVIPRRYATLFGVIYAISLGVWYFSSIEESKIVTATLSALYIAIYLQLRERWTRRGVVVLTAVLLIACLNEIVSGFLIIIPVVDTLLRRGWDWREGRWIALHALAGPVALAILEGIIRRWLGEETAHPEGASHLGMFLYYIAKNDYSATNLYSFVINWLFFNIAAPTAHADYAVPTWATYKGYFEPVLANYFSSPASASLVTLLAVITIAAALSRHRPSHISVDRAAILLALTAYSFVRGLFFIIFNPSEPLLFSPAVTLAHLLIIGILFTASKLPAKRMLLAGCAVLLFITNAAFIISS